MDLMIPFQLITCLGLGAFIGLEREYHKDEFVTSKKHTIGTLGIRTFSLTSLLGGLSGIIYSHNLALFILISTALFILILLNYVISSLATKDSGTTTEIANLFTYLLGILITLNVLPLPTIVAITVFVALILSRKHEIKQLVYKLHRFETNAFINYAVIALVILPFLPNQSIALSDIGGLSSFLSAYHIQLDSLLNIEIINPYKLWYVVTLITGIEVVGYFLTKTIGKAKGLLISSLTAGFVSSTAMTIALAKDSKHTHSTNYLVASALFANGSSFFQLFALIAPLNPNFLVESTPFVLSLIVPTFIVAFVFLNRKQINSEKKHKKLSPVTTVFSIGPALKFACIFLVVRYFSKLGITYFGNSGLYVTSALGALSGLDAVTISVTELAGKSIGSSIGITALFIANAVNLLAKIFYSKSVGSGEFTWKFGLAVSFVILVSFVTILVF